MKNDIFLRACKLEKTEYTPVWFMRQAGRYQPEYLKIKEKYSIIDISTTPEISAEVTLLPINQFNLDTAIIFSDILIPLGPMGISFEYKKGYGPLIHNPIKNLKDVERLKVIDPSIECAYTGKALEILKKELDVPCIGFVGAPFTLASYMIEGGPSKNYAKMKALMYTQPKTWHLLMDKLATVMGNYLNFQIASGASVVQVFDSWIGALDVDDYQHFVYPHMEKLMGIIRAENKGTPIILFGVNARHLNPLFKQLGATVVGIDWKTDLMEEWNRIGKDVAVQGNLDPTLLFADWPMIERKAKMILDSTKGQDGFIFNLGHGILPGTPVENVRMLTDFVHDYTK